MLTGHASMTNGEEMVAHEKKTSLIHNIPRHMVEKETENKWGKDRTA